MIFILKKFLIVTQHKRDVSCCCLLKIAIMWLIVYWLVVADDDGDVGGSMKVLLEAFVTQLPNCVNRELIDKVM